MRQTPPITDSEVRRRLGAPSIECLLIKARLQYLGRVCRGRHCFPTLWAILDKKCGSAQKGMEADNSSAPIGEHCGPCHHGKAVPAVS